MSKQKELLASNEAQRIANVSEVLTNAAEDHKDEGYDTILLIMANEDYTAYASAGTGIDLGLALTRALLRHPNIIPIFQSSTLTAIDLLKEHADNDEQD